MKTFPKRRKVGSVAILLAAFAVGVSFVVANLVQWQFVEGERLQNTALNNQMRDMKIDAMRGTIYDSNMEIMAQSATVWNVFISPSALVRKAPNDASAEEVADAEARTEKNRQTLAKGLAEILGMDSEEIYRATLKTESGQVYLKKKVETDIRDAIVAFRSANQSVASSIGLEETTKRYYPNGELAATVLGFTGTDDQGLAGLEAQYDETLSGTDGRVMTIVNALGNEINYDYKQRIEAIDGNSLVLTIDSTIQGYLEKHLDEAIDEYGVMGRAVGIIMNVNTFEILGMSVRGSFDPNNPFAIADEETAAEIELLTGQDRLNALQIAQNYQWRNTAISDPYEPGSVFKAFTAAGALDEGAVSMLSTFECKGIFNVSNAAWYRCNNHAVHGVQTVTNALENSCNIAFIQIGERLGASAFSRYYSAFGFTEKTGIDLPGEMGTTAGVHYHALSSMGTTELASSSFGQSQKMTPIQVISAMASVVNGGYLGTPHLVSQVVDSEGKILSTVDAGTRRQVISEETSALMRGALEKVVEEGGGKNAGISGYRIGGKTGTAEKLDSNEEEKSWIVSFCGFAPADDPEVVCLIVIDHPTLKTYGSTVAAPTFKEIMKDVLEYLGVEKNGDETAEIEQVAIPYVIDRSVADAKTAITAQNLKVKVKGSGENVVAQYPDPETILDVGSTVYLFTDEESIDDLTVVPDFTGLTLTEANRLAVENDLNINIAGTTGRNDAVVVSQSIEKDSKATRGMIITLRFVSESGAD